MTRSELERRLQTLLAQPDNLVEPELSGPEIRRAAAVRAATARVVQQNDAQPREVGEPIGAGHPGPSQRKDHLMSSDILHHDEVMLVDDAPARPRHRLALVSGAVLAAAAAAVLATALVPGHGNSTGATGPAAAVPSAPHRAATHHEPTTTDGPYVYVHHTFGSGGYQDVWIPADPTNGVWALKVRAPLQSVAEHAKCAAFPYYELSQVKTSHGLVPKNPLPGCVTSAGWNGPYRPPFAESLPTDPQALLADMRRNSGGGTDAETFSLGSDFVTSGWVPKDIASNVVAALKLIPGVVEKRDVANGAGARGTALTYTGAIKPAVPETWGVIVDPHSGEVIGSTFSYSGHPTEVDSITRTTVDTSGAEK